LSPALRSWSPADSSVFIARPFGSANGLAIDAGMLIIRLRRPKPAMTGTASSGTPPFITLGHRPPPELEMLTPVPVFDRCAALGLRTCLQALHDGQRLADVVLRTEVVGFR
jgi:hypothetical protein